MSAAGGLFACHRLCAGPLKTRRGKMLRRSPSKTPGRKAARSSCGRRKAAKNLPLTGMWPPNGASPGEKAGNFARNRISFVRQRFLKGSFSTFLTACNGAKYPIGRAFLAGKLPMLRQAAEDDDPVGRQRCTANQACRAGRRAPPAPENAAQEAQHLSKLPGRLFIGIIILRFSQRSPCFP